MGKHRLHATVALDALLEAVEAAGNQVELLALLMESPDRTVRRWGFARAHRQNMLRPERLASLANSERDQLLRAEAIRWLAAVATREQLLDLLHGRFVDGRLLALTQLDDTDLGTQLVTAMLDDPSARVRETARWRAHRRGIDPASSYRDWLREGGRPPSRLAASIDGLAALGTRDDFELVRSYLADRSVRVRAAAVSGVAVLAEPTRARGLLGPLLLDSSPRVSAAAARGLARAGGTHADAAAALASEQPWSRRAGWRLSRSAGGWARVVADLSAAADEDPLLAGLGLAGLRNWLDGAAATTWGQPSEADRTHIDQLLPRVGLTRRECRIFAFHSGINLEPEAAPQASGVASTRRGLLRLLRRPKRSTAR